MRIIKKLLLVLAFVFCFEVISDVSPKDSHAAFDSLLEFENRTNYSGFFDFLIKIVEDIYTCFWGNIVLNFGELKQTCIPRLITQDGNYEEDCNGSDNNQGFINRSSVSVGVFIASLLAIVFASGIPIIGQLAWVWAGISIINLIVTCLGSYILAPHEYMNYILDYWHCDNDNGEIKNTHPDAITAVDVPFFYKCLENTVPKDLKIGDSRLDDEYGNMNDSSTPYCQPGNKKYAVNNIKDEKLRIPGKDLIGGIIVQKVSFWKLIKVSSRSACDISADTQLVFTRNDIFKGTQKNDTIGFYRLYSGKIQLCSATSTMVVPIINGCTYVVPPIEMINLTASYTENTRCSYFLSSRSDLNSLGSSINRDGHSSVGLFLQSDLHIISTLVGCIQDLLSKIVVNTSNNTEDSFLWQIQNIMRNIVKVVLILYIALLGIKIISNPQVPQMGEVVMYILKFGFVVIMSGLLGPKIWYNNDANQNHGLYNLLIDSMDDLSNRVLQSTNTVSPVNMCYFDYGDGKNLLSEREIPKGSKYPNITPTVSLRATKDNVKVTVWDYIDCKLMGYLNLNSCKYTISGMISFWLVSTCIFFPATFLLGVTTIIFCIVLFTTMTKFVHLVVVSIFSLTILVLVSPIMVCFILFDYTKQTFQTWFKMMIGYVLYPALILSFVALMLTTFDAIFYGQVSDPSCLKNTSCSIYDICYKSDKDTSSASFNNNSVYCVIASSVHDVADKNSLKDIHQFNPTLCDVSSSKIFDAINGTMAVKILGIEIYKSQNVRDGVFTILFQAMIKMMLFVILFANISDAVVNFLETLLSIQGISSAVQGGEKVGQILKKAAMSGAKMPLNVAKMAYNKMSKRN